MHQSPAQVECVRLLKQMSVEDAVSYGSKSVLLVIAAVLFHYSSESYGWIASQCCLIAGIICTLIGVLASRSERHIIQMVKSVQPVIVRIESLDPYLDTIRIITSAGPRIFEIHDSRFSFLNQYSKSFQLNQRARTARKLTISDKFAGSRADMYLDAQDGSAVIFLAGTALHLRSAAPMINNN